MKKIRFVSLVLTALLLLSMLPITASPAEIDKIVIDFRKESSVPASGFRLYKHNPTVYEPDPLLGGKYSFDGEKQAIRVEYSPCDQQNDYRLMLSPISKNLLGDKKYAVIVYMAKTAANYRLNIWNTHKKGDEALFAAEGKDTGGKFVVSEPVSIEGTRPADNNLTRWNAGGLNTVNFITTDKNAEFYIKEISFFNTPEDAKAYYAAADLSKPASQYTSPIVKFDITPTDDAFEDNEVITGNPLVMKFGTSADMRYSGAAYYTHGDNHTEGKYEAVQLDGVKAIKLLYEPHREYPYLAYRCMPKFINTDKITTDYKYVRVTFMTNDDLPFPIVLQHNGTHQKVTLVPDASVSNGEWVTSTPIRIDTNGILDRFAGGKHCILGYDCNTNGHELYIKELSFFTTEAQAYEHYGDSAEDQDHAFFGYNIMSFGGGAGGKVLSGESYGNNTVNTDTGTVDIFYAPETNAGVSYMAKVQFEDTASYDIENRYVRVLYSAKNPDGVTGASLLMRNDKTHEVICLKKELTDTDGFVLSDVTRLTDDMAQRFDGSVSYTKTMHNSLIVNHVREGGEYKIKALFFFPNRDAAEAFEYSDTHNITVNGTDIGEYSVVYPKNCTESVKEAAKAVVNHISYMTGKKIFLKDDSSSPERYEILVGATNRPESAQALASAQADVYHEKRTVGAVIGDRVAINATVAPLVLNAVNDYLSAFFYKSKAGAPDNIQINGDSSLISIGAALTYSTIWHNPSDALDPTVIKIDFEKDEGYFTEKNGGDNWKYSAGAYAVGAASESLSYVHVYEKNVDVSADLTAANGTFGVMARYTSDDAFVKAGYDFEAGEWFIDYREGLDFDPERAARQSATFDGNANVKLTLRGEDAELYVDGAKLLSGKVTQLTPGRIGLFAENTALTADNFEAVLVSGEGTVLKNVEYNLLPDEQYREGGTVMEMSDGSLIYQTHFSNYNTFKSIDNGKTFIRVDKWTDTTQYPNLLRLKNGDIIKIMTETRNGKSYKTSQTSSDDGKTWKAGGIICNAMFENATAVNMNDKVTQSARTGRIFYCQNYEVLSGSAVDGRMVFCEFYYSDDNGATWTKSATDSWEIPGNETETHFGECKILECADGTLRMYNSWNAYGCIVYSESKDNGKTWGELVTMPEFVCARSSMQFFRDPWGATDTTYYMVWVYSVPESASSGMTRSRLSLAYTEDGKSWEFLGDLWRWESNWKTKVGSFINHIVDPFVMTTEDYVIVGTGASEKIALVTDTPYHQAQRQHIWSIPKASLPEGKEVTLRENLGNFTDVTTHDDFYEGVKFAVDNGLFNGTSDTTFSPAASMTRAMFVTVLGRLAKADTAAYAAPTFADVLADQWYTGYVGWANANGIVKGMTETEFGVNGNVTVQQACVILARYANYATAANVTGKTAADFTDGTAVADWAAKEVDWAIANGIYEGAGASLNPTSPASRATVATMFANYVKAFG